MILGVVGAGTMGAGIAQLGAEAGLRTLLHDPDAAALARVEAPIETVDALVGLAECDLVVEAAPERLELKRELFAALAEVVSADCVLATNTSSLSVTELAAAVPHPERVVGLHFFNPPTRMRLVEVVAGARSSERALAVASGAGEALGKRVVAAQDVAGFLVNRANRPFALESLKLLEERVAGFETIDRVLRLGAGFRMGAFELMDLVGIDVNHAVAESFQRQSFGEPRYRPSPLAARKVAARTLGRKTGSGWYAYADGERHRPKDPDVPAPASLPGPVAVLGDEPLADALRAAIGSDPQAAEPWLTVDLRPAGAPRADGPVLRLVREHFLAVLDPTAAGFHALMPFESSRLIELTRTPRTDPTALARAQELCGVLGRHFVLLADVPGLVTGRVVGQLVNEAAFLLGAGLGSAEDVDAGLELGVAHPRGPVAWSEAIGVDSVVATLDGLRHALGEERYRVAPRLRRAAALGVGLRDPDSE